MSTARFLIFAPLLIWYLYWFIRVLIDDMHWTIKQLILFKERNLKRIAKEIGFSILNAACAPPVIAMKHGSRILPVILIGMLLAAFLKLLFF